jgi:hypothetical protein
MNAKEYLQEIRTTDEMIDEMLKDRDHLSGMRYRITQNLKPVVSSGGGAHGGFTNASDGLIDLEREIDREVDRLVDMKREALPLLAKLRNPKHYKVLNRYYIRHETFEKIAVDMGCSYRNVCYIHGRALQAFQRVLDAREG